MFTLGAVAIGGTLVSGGLGILIFWLTSCRTATGGQTDSCRKTIGLLPEDSRTATGGQTDSYRGTAGRREMRGYGQK